MDATDYLNPFKLAGAALSGASKIVVEAPEDFMAGWDSMWEEPAKEQPKKQQPTPEQIQAKIAELQGMLPDEPTSK